MATVYPCCNRWVLRGVGGAAFETLDVVGVHMIGKVLAMKDRLDELEYSIIITIRESSHGLLGLGHLNKQFRALTPCLDWTK